jgi:glycosyltransferase involved in cell wall biosynthesis
MSDTRVLWWGDMAATGFGTVTMDVGRAMLAMGYDVRFISQNAIPKLPEPFASRTLGLESLITAEATIQAGHIEPAGISELAAFIPNILQGKQPDDGYFMTTGEAWGDWKPDVNFLLGDYMAAELFLAPYVKDFSQVPTFHYVPIEGVGLPPSWAQLWRIVRPVAMSKFGREQIKGVIGYEPPLIYHGVDADTFHPATPSTPIVLRDEKEEGLLHSITSKARAKAYFGQDPKRRWVFRNDRHMPRKNYNALIRSMVPVLESHPDVDLVIHCRPIDQGGNLRATLSKYPSIQKQVILTGMGPVPRDVLAVLINAADIFASCSAEGFGLCIAEAIACGVPAVGLEYSAVPEVIGPAGMVVPIESLTDNEYDHFWARPDEAKLGESVAWLLDHPARARDLGAQGPKHVRDNFSWTQAAEGFARLADEVVSSPQAG